MNDEWNLNDCIFKHFNIAYYMTRAKCAQLLKRIAKNVILWLVNQSHTIQNPPYATTHLEW